MLLDDILQVRLGSRLAEPDESLQLTSGDRDVIAGTATKGEVERGENFASALGETGEGGKKSNDV
jgi:hypothetical protein